VGSAASRWILCSCLRKRAAVKGWYSDPSVDSEDTLQLSRHSGGVSLNEIFPVLRVH
jgi:hypothetical protein